MYVILLPLLSIFSYVVCVCVFTYIHVLRTCFCLTSPQSTQVPAKASGRGGGVQVEPQRLAADLGLQGGMDFSMKHEIITIWLFYQHMISYNHRVS